MHGFGLTDRYFSFSCSNLYARLQISPQVFCRATKGMYFSPHITQIRGAFHRFSLNPSSPFDPHPIPKTHNYAEELHLPQSLHTSPRYRKRAVGSSPQFCNVCSFYRDDSPCAGSSSNPFAVTTSSMTWFPVRHLVRFVCLALLAEQESRLGIQLVQSFLQPFTQWSPGSPM